MRLFVLLAALAPAVALSQPDPEPPVSETAPDSTATPAGALFSFAVLADAARPPEPPPAPDPAPAPEPLSPTLHALGTSGLTVLTPAGWDGPTSSVEGRGYSLYTVRNEAADYALGAVTLRIERVIGLNPLLRERFTRGQTSYGTHGATPVGPATVPHGFGVEVRGPGTGGATTYVERGAALWTVSVQAPLAMWEDRRTDVLALMAAVTLP